MASVLCQHGGKELTGTSAITPTAPHQEFFVIVPNSAMTFSAATSATGVDSPDLTALTWALGIPIYGRWTSITPASGDGVAYYED